MLAPPIVKFKVVLRPASQLDAFFDVGLGGAALALGVRRLLYLVILLPLL